VQVFQGEAYEAAGKNQLHLPTNCFIFSGMLFSMYILH